MVFQGFRNTHDFSEIQEYKEFFKDSDIQRVVHDFRNTKSFSWIQENKEFMDSGIQRAFHGFRNTESFLRIQKSKEFFMISGIHRVFMDSGIKFF